MSRPHAEVGICDDWCYLRIAQLLAQTGHLHYNGYATPIIGWQLYVAQLFIKIFGFSFTAVRASTVLIGTAAVFLVERTFVRSGIRQGNAVIGTLAFALSPLYMLLSTSFMSDVGGLLALLSAFYACLRALQARSSRHALAWIVLALASNLVLGSSRQIAWLGVLVIVPCTLWQMRKNRTLLLSGALATTIAAGLIALTLHWFQRQPYSVPEHLLPKVENLARVAYMASQLSRALLEIPFLLLAVSLAFLPELWRGSKRVGLAIAACLAAYSALALLLVKHHGVNTILEPLLGDWVGPHGYYEGILLNGAGPVVLGTGVRVALTLLSITSLLCALAAVYRLASARGFCGTSLPGAPSWGKLCVLFVPFSVAYFSLLIPRSAVTLMDRYLLPLLFIACLFAIRFYQDFIKPQLPMATIAAVGCVAIYGLAMTHDMFSLYRARVQLVDELRAEGVPQNAIDGGLEYNGWVELMQSSHINDPRIVNPPGAYQPTAGSRGFDCQGLAQTDVDLPHFAPRYGLSFDRNACMGPATAAPVSYFRWFGMHTAELYAVRY